MKLLGRTISNKAIMLNVLALSCPILDLAVANAAAVQTFLTPSNFLFFSFALGSVNIVWHQFQPLIVKDVKDDSE